MDRKLNAKSITQRQNEPGFNLYIFVVPRLTRYHLDGRYKIDNNLVENTIRPLALGRKNYMFCGNHDAAENAAIMYSLLGCCAASDVNPREWLTDVLTRIPYYNNDYSLDLADLLPHKWKATRELSKTPVEIQ